MATKKPVQLDHHHFGVEPDDPSFDLNRARKAHADVMARWDDPKEGDDFKALMLHAIQNATAEQIETHRGEIQRFINEFGKKSSQALSKAVIKSYVGSAVGAAQEFGKDRHWVESDWKRDHGRFSSFTGSPSEGDYGPSYAEHMRQQALLGHVARIASAAGREQPVQYRIKDKAGNIRITEPTSRTKLPKLKRGEAVVGAKGAGIRGDDLSLGEHSFNLMQALGASAGTAAGAVRGAAAAPSFAHEWTNHANKHYGDETGKSYRRISAGADALNSIAGANPKAQVAVKVGRFVGEHGAEAEKVLGPRARKTAYKYRGVERAPRDDLPEGADHDALVGRISRHIPTRTVHDLNLASGYTAPSHGYLRDKNDKVTVEAHGYGDDHYLPFKLSGLHKLKGGSYIRTRSTGGPTTEDVYASAISGANQFTVSSRQGTYVVGFDDEFTHQKRLGDIALGMSKRYGKILDAVASGKVRAHGEVSDRQYQEFYEGALAGLPADTPNREARAHQIAEGQRTAQEGKEGRQLSLDGEGYDYALKSLASQYPYYLRYADRSRPNAPSAEQDSTGYFHPGDQRFWDADPNTEGGHYERIGNRAERDTGYVKPRHLKSAHALIGYHDPTIRGETLSPSGQRTGSGKLAGDQAFYQNWAHNPYNQRGSRPSQGSGGQQGQQGGGAAPQPGGSGHREASQPQGSGRTDITGDNARSKQLYQMVLAAHKANKDKGADDSTLRQWAGNRQAFLDDYARDPHGTANYVQDAHGDAGLTNARAHTDENADTVLDTEHAKGEHRDLATRLQSADAWTTRQDLLNATDKLYQQDPDKHAAAGHYGRLRHHDVPRNDLLNMAYPSGTPNRAKLTERAHELMNNESRAVELQNKHQVDEPFDPGEDDPNADESEEGAKAAAEDFNEDPETKRLAHAQVMTNAMDELQEHSADQGEQNAIATVKTRWQEAEDNAHDPEYHNAAVQMTNHMLTRFRDVADRGVSNHEGRTVPFHTLHASSEYYGKRWSVSKRNGRLVIRKAA